MDMQTNMARCLNAKKQENKQAWEAIATQAGIGKTTMTNYSKGTGNPRLDTIEQLCQNLGVTPNMLLLGDSVDQFLLEHVVPTIGVVASLPFEKQLAFVNLCFQMMQLLVPDKSPDSTKQNEKVEESV